MLYELTLNDYRQIKSKSIDNFVEKSLQYKENYDIFLTKCIISAFLDFIQSKNLILKDGKLYVADEQQKENEKC